MPICLSCRLVFAFVGLVLTTLPALSHEFWIEPQKYQVDSGQPVIADLRNGQKFTGSKLVYFARRTQRFDIMQADQVTPYQGRMGDLPAFQLDQIGDGLLVISHETVPETLTYDTWEMFQAFVTHKGLTDILQRHQARGLPEQDFTETYSRHAKTLIAIGDGIGADSRQGMETEFVALANPYTDDLSLGMPVQLIYQGQPRTETQVEVFERDPDGSVSIFLHHTDTQGHALIPVKTGHTYLLDAVVIRPAPDAGGPVWETLWAALTFAVP